MLTCTHLVEGLVSPWIAYDGQKAPAKVIMPEGEIALLQVQGMTGEPVPLGLEWQPDDPIDALGCRSEGTQSGERYFSLTETILGRAKYDSLDTITLTDSIPVWPGSEWRPGLKSPHGPSCRAHQ